MALIADEHIPYVSLGTDERRNEYFADGLHLTVKGYDKLASLAFEILQPETDREAELGRVA